MRNELTTARRTTAVGRFIWALLLITVFVLHPACPPDPAHHGPYTPGLSAELCHHGETQHLSASAPGQAAVQASTASVADVDLPAPAIAAAASASSSCPWRSEHVSSGHALLLDLGISRT